MSNRLYLDQSKKQFVVLSYAGGTKYFRQLTETRLKTFVPVNGSSVSPAQSKFDVIQVVREPIPRFMSWFDKQYIKPMWKQKDIDFTRWTNRLMTKTWIDNFFKELTYFCHYDGHINFQSVWPKVNLASLWRDDWSFLKMEDINPYFLNQPKFDLFKDPKEYTGVWEVLNDDIKEYTMSKIEEVYSPELDWYNRLNFIKID